MAKFQPKVPKGSVSRYEKALTPKKYADSGRKPKLRSPMYAPAQLQPYQQKMLDEAWERLSRESLGDWAVDLAAPQWADTGRYRKEADALPVGVNFPKVGDEFVFQGKRYRVTQVFQDSVMTERVPDGPSQEEQDALAALNLS